MSPIPTSATLPSINLPIEIPVNPLLGCIYSLLSDETLMTSENLIFPDMNDLSVISPFNGIYGEINSGLAYHSFEQTVHNFGNAVPIPLIFFIDGTAIDRAGRHLQTPIMFTLGIFKQSVRNQSKAWRNLGFVKSNVKEQYSQKDIKDATQNKHTVPKNNPCYVPDNHDDFHTQIHCIFNDLLRIQALKRGLKWKFVIDGIHQVKEYRLFFPILFFAGDTMEHNKLCSLHGGSMSKFPCRLCCTTRDNLDNPAAVPLRKMANGNKMRDL